MAWLHKPLFYCVDPSCTQALRAKSQIGGKAWPRALDKVCPHKAECLSHVTGFPLSRSSCTLLACSDDGGLQQQTNLPPPLSKLSRRDAMKFVCRFTQAPIWPTAPVLVRFRE